MKIIGVTGGVGSGKTLVLNLLKEEFGACIIMADEVGRMLMKPGQICYQEIVDEFGSQIVTEDGNINRDRLAQIIFHDRDARHKMENIVHPAVKEEIKREISYANNEFIIVEAALLIEDNYKEICEELWYVFAPQEIRVKRLAEGRGYSDAKTKSIIENQLSDSEFRRHCTKVIDNGGTVTETRKQLEALLRD